MAWIFLLLAGVFEVGWVIGMKYSEGFTKLVPSGLMVVAMCLSLWFLTLAVKTLPLGTSYAVWTGIGAMGAMEPEAVELVTKAVGEMKQDLGMWVPGPSFGKVRISS